MKRDWKSVIGAVAPTLAHALGGPLAGLAVGAISKAVLNKDTATEDEISEAVAAGGVTTETLARLREADLQFKSEMKRLDVDIFKLEIQDKASARDLYTTNYWPQIVLSCVYNFGYFGMLFLFLLGKVRTPDLPPEMQGAFLALLGVLTAALPQINGFWFGSSFGSKEKTAALAASPAIVK